MAAERAARAWTSPTRGGGPCGRAGELMGSVLSTELGAGRRLLDRWVAPRKGKMRGTRGAQTICQERWPAAQEARPATEGPVLSILNSVGTRSDTHCHCQAKLHTCQHGAVPRTVPRCGVVVKPSA